MILFFFFELEDAPQVIKPKVHWDKQFMDSFKKLTHRNQNWRVWSDFCEMAACAISNSVDKQIYEKREKRYMDIIGNYDRKEAEEFPKLLAIVTQALDDNPEQDFLGVLFQEMSLSSHWKGQFFTPYSVCKMMAEMQSIDLPELIKEKGHVNINDPTCGAGALLIAFANVAKEKGINYQNHIEFVGQDIDHTAAHMCYIQLSLIGCPGYVIIGNTLTNLAPQPEDHWYTPMYFSNVWHWRRLFQQLSRLEVISQ